MKQYLDLLQHILDHGIDKTDRTVAGTKSEFGYQMRFDLKEGFPLLTTKRLHLKSIIYELLWFLKGDTNIKYLHEHNISIWDEWTDEQGDLHMNQLHLQLTREPRTLPYMKLNPDIRNIFDFDCNDFMLENYDPYPHIK